MRRPLLYALAFVALLSACSGGGSEPSLDVTPASDVPDAVLDAGAPDSDEADTFTDADAPLPDADVPEDVPTEADVVVDVWEGAGTFIEEKMAVANIPGMAVAVTRPGEVVWIGVYGLANVEANLPVTVDTPFMLASVSKTVTGVAVMHAWEEGLLTLEDEINNLLPFTVDNPRVEDEVIRVRHLVSHTSGIRDNWGNMPYFDGDPTVSLGDYLEGYLVEGGQWYNANQNFNATLPGTAFDYGNIATALAGYVVEVVTETPFDDYCDANIFTVLGMERTGWYLADFDASLVAMPYDYVNGAYEALGHYGYADYPDGQLRSSVSDIARFLAAISNDGVIDEDRVLNAATVSELFSPPVPAVDSTQYVFWYGSNVAGRSVIGHNGGDQGVATQMSFSPETGVGVIILMNTSWRDAVGGAADAVQDLLFDRAEDL